MALNEKSQEMRRYKTMAMSGTLALSVACSTVSQGFALQHDLLCKVQSF